MLALCEEVRELKFQYFMLKFSVNEYNLITYAAYLNDEVSANLIKNRSKINIFLFNIPRNMADKWVIRITKVSSLVEGGGGVQFSLNPKSTNKR